MLLSKDVIHQIKTTGLRLPKMSIFDLPERVLQFGTGDLLRALPDHCIDQANQRNIFNGRIVAVKSTDAGQAIAFEQQNGLYTLYLNGTKDDEPDERQYICAAISRVLAAETQWLDVLECASSIHISIIISNTKETGIKLTMEHIGATAPTSFPAKLLAVLFKRYNVFNGSAESGLLILPTELIPNNGQLLKQYIIELAAFNNLPPQFVNWLKHNNHFCNTMVDRIVAGKPEKSIIDQLNAKSGYVDQFRTVAERHASWIIEGDESIANRIPFQKWDGTIKVVPNLDIYRNLKVFLLDGIHTLCCGAALLSGFTTVGEAANNHYFWNIIEKLTREEIVPSLPFTVDLSEAASYCNHIKKRLQNTLIAHKWSMLSFQYSLKIRIRIIPLIHNYYIHHGKVPKAMAVCFAAFICFMRVQKQGNVFVRILTGNKSITVHDTNAAYFHRIWHDHPLHEVINCILSNRNLWGTDLAGLPGFRNAVCQYADKILEGHSPLDILTNLPISKVKL